MNNRFHSASLLLILGLCSGLQAAGPLSSLKPVTFIITDSDGDPVPSAEVKASKPGPGDAEGLTDAKGHVVLNLAQGTSLYVEVTTDGYYRTGGEIWRGGMTRGEEVRLVPRELPDRFEIVLKPVLDPVFLHHHLFRGHAPRTQEPVAFDLKVGDWVAPYGKGVTTDLYFHFKDIYSRDNEFAGTMEITFPTDGDGIQPFQAARPFSMEFGSDLAPPNVAPENGYLASLSYSLAHRDGEPYQTYRKDQRNYLLRTRTVRDAQGQIIQACYAWIRGEIEFDPRGQKGPQLVFESYFNPDPDPAARSLEYNLHTMKSR